MERRGSKLGKLETFAKSKVARATAAVALTFAAASAVEKTTSYDTFPNVEVAHADGENLLPNPGFEDNIDNNSVPDGYDKTSPNLIGANYEFQISNPVPHTGQSYISAEVIGLNIGECGINGFKVADIPIDETRTYRLSFYARTDSDTYNVGIKPATVIEFDDINNDQIGSLNQRTYSAGPVGSWQASPTTVLIGPGKDIVPPAGTESIKLELNSSFDSDPGTCTSQIPYAKESFDDISLVEVFPLSVGGVAEAPNITELEAIKDSQKDDDSKLPLAAGAAAAAAITAGGALLYSRRKTS